jgi:hypothetical protein
VPRVCQPLVTPPAFAAYMNTLLGPENAGEKFTGRFTVNVLPLMIVVTPLKPIEH